MNQRELSDLTMFLHYSYFSNFFNSMSDNSFLIGIIISNNEVFLEPSHYSKEIANLINYKFL